MRDRKDMRGKNYAYYISCFLILLLTKSSIEKTNIIVSMFYTSRIFTISHLFTRFFCGHIVRK